ncbi:PREDICTED: uncharacterized protein LOC108375952 [Rhagoletis zephyria]|uniref:uncharacterized protein LOC108375952 n=1 Tax=Rhagoletis zephyria TaxID=28612 RepID=UPI000811585F|nr:PREDICTED: uncharacterized protein LOC108375952 [Rhagoletis zephyria]XP_036319890.1 uncharacterized protein LOC118734284 [Rhagoletis pomonella]
MGFKPLLLLCVVLFASASARSVRDVSTGEEAPSALNLFEIINENFKKIGDTVSKSINPQQFEETGRDLAKQLDQWSANIKKETESWKDNPAIKSFVKTVDNAVEEIKKSTDVKGIVDAISVEKEKLGPKLKELKETTEPQLKDLSQKILEQTSSTVQDIAKLFQQEVKQ